MRNRKCDESPFEMRIIKLVKKHGTVETPSPESPEVERLQQLERQHAWAELCKLSGIGKGEPVSITPELLAYLVDMSRKMDLSRWPWLSLVASLGSGLPYGILENPNELETLIDLRGPIEYVSAEDARKIDRFLQTRAKKVVADIKRRLRLRPGRPRDYMNQMKWGFGADLRKHGYSWAKITQKLNPEGYVKDRKGAVDRMRLGIQSISRKKQRPSTPPKKIDPPLAR